MSRYYWPPPRDGRRGGGRAGQRMAYNAGADAGADPAAIDAARTMRRRSERAALVGPELAPTGPRNAWQPLGPTTTLLGSGDGSPRVAGRVRDLAVSDDGNRIYAATAQGGLWYSGDAGATWEPVGAWAATVDRDELLPSSMTLACGAVHVRFGADVGADEVWVGTGEGWPSRIPMDVGFVGRYAGVGILHRVGPVQASRAQPNVDPWQREAQPTGSYNGLTGAGVFALARDPSPAGPTAGRSLVAATTRGLHRRDPATGQWSLVTVPAWEAPAGPGSSLAVVTDVAWVMTPTGSQLWLAVADDDDVPSPRSAVRGIWNTGPPGAPAWTKVALPGATTPSELAGLSRIALAAAPSDGRVLYVLANGPRLWRIDGATVRRVAPIPSDLFGRQARYDMALAVDPQRPERIMLGGKSVNSNVEPGTVSAALYRLTVRRDPPAAPAWTTDFVAGQAVGPRWVGAGVHPDVHRIRWVHPGAPAGGGHVVVACDGGVFRSVDDGAPLSFTSRNTGLAVGEAGFVAAHPTSDGVVLAGFQDNGVQLRIGESVWRRALLNGDGGGVAFDPVRPDQFVGQHARSFWTDQADSSVTPTLRNGDTKPHLFEHDRSSFYSNAAAMARTDGTTQLAVGTIRVWYSEQWGRSRPGPTGIWRREWVTLPSGRDPRANDAFDVTTDVLPTGPLPFDWQDSTPGIRALRWTGENRLYALLPGAIHRVDRARGVWSRVQIYTRLAKGGPEAPFVPGPALPARGAWNDLAVDDPARGVHGSFYLATSIWREPVWWFDGMATWHPCELGRLPPPSPPPPPPNAPDGVRAPAYSVVVAGGDPQIVFVGTTVGVWRGERRFVGGSPQWRWTSFANGLPEAAVQDLALDTYPLPQGGSVRLLRAAIQARGLWEVELDAPLVPLVYVRAVPYDTRRMVPASLDDPMFRAGQPERLWHLDWADVRNRDFRTATGTPGPSRDSTPPGRFLWHASPDVRVRPAPGAAALPAPGSLPWTQQPADRFALWALQTALHAIDPRVVPNGQWTHTFGRYLRAIRQARGLSDVARVDAQLWAHADVQARFWADPWADGGPTEADLVQRLVGMATPRPGRGGPLAAAVSTASVAVRAGLSKVDVCLHGRGIEPWRAGQVSVLLLRQRLPDDALRWLLLPAPSLRLLEAPMEAARAEHWALPSAAVPVGWEVADTTQNIRRPRDPIAAGRPAVVTFDVGFTFTQGDPRHHLLLAVVHAGSGTPVGVNDTLRELVRRSPHVAARSVQVVPV